MVGKIIHTHTSLLPIQNHRRFASVKHFITTAGGKNHLPATVARKRNDPSAFGSSPAPRRASALLIVCSPLFIVYQGPSFGGTPCRGHGRLKPVLWRSWLCGRGRSAASSRSIAGGKGERSREIMGFKIQTEHIFRRMSLIPDRFRWSISIAKFFRLRAFLTTQR